jgi:hypothetical protein
LEKFLDECSHYGHFRATLELQNSKSVQVTVGISLFFKALERSLELLGALMCLVCLKGPKNGERS